MSNMPPPIPGLPPIIPAPNSPPRPSKNRFPLAAKLVLAGFSLFVAFFAFRLVQFGLHLKNNPTPKVPGEAEFREANRLIIANRGTTAFGNNPEAVALAAEYGQGLKRLREGFFTEGNKDAFSMATGEFLTYCQWNGDSCVFLVHVPELRRFTSDAQKSLVELAWINAQSVLKAGKRPPPKSVAVGVKGALLYEAILIGEFIADPQTEGDGVKAHSSGLQDTKLFFPFFASK